MGDLDENFVDLASRNASCRLEQWRVVLFGDYRALLGGETVNRVTRRLECLDSSPAHGIDDALGVRTRGGGVTELPLNESLDHDSMRDVAGVLLRLSVAGASSRVGFANFSQTGPLDVRKGRAALQGS